MAKTPRFVDTLLLLSVCLAPIPVSASHGGWGYEGDTGPEHWGSLSREYAACSAGQAQSPVDIPPVAPVNPPDLQLDYKPSPLAISNNGHSIQADYAPGSSLEVNGASYPLVQFHLHSLSEHTLNGEATPMELHLVHRDSRGRIAVIGVMLVEGAQNAAYEALLANLPASPAEPKTIDAVTVDAGRLLPPERDYYRYDGSLTTPPCTEGVKWFVMARPVELSAGQIAAFRAVYQNNYRPVQPLNGRAFLLTAEQPPAILPATGGSAGLVLVALACIGLLTAFIRLGARR